MSNTTKRYSFEDGSYLLLKETPDEYVLEEYDSNRKIVTYSYHEGFKLIRFNRVKYNKKAYSLQKVISDIYDEYGLRET